jgi:hypothetical protein
LAAGFDADGYRLRDRCRMEPSDRRAVFRKAVRDLNDNPTPENVRRYLAASRLLELALARPEPATARQ